MTQDAESGDGVAIEIADGVLTIRLNRPDRLNAINGAMREDLKAAFARAESDDSVRAVLLTGNGRAFCTGQDLAERKPLPDGAKYDLGQSLEEGYGPLIRTITGLPKPVVAAVNGVAAGAGASLALLSDVAFASTSARFVFSFANIGLAPDCGATWTLPRLVGTQRAKAIAMGGEPVSAQDAERWGMIWKVLPPEELIDVAHDFAARLAAKGPQALATIKQLVDESSSNTFAEQLDRERDCQRALGLTEDYAEGVAAFWEKRPPRFTGR